MKTWWDEDMLRLRKESVTIGPRNFESKRCRTVQPDKVQLTVTSRQHNTLQLRLMRHTDIDCDAIVVARVDHALAYRVERTQQRRERKTTVYRQRVAKEHVPRVHSHVYERQSRPASAWLLFFFPFATPTQGGSLTTFAIRGYAPGWCWVQQNLWDSHRCQCLFVCWWPNNKTQYLQ